MPPRLFIENYCSTTDYFSHLLHALHDRCHRLVSRLRKARQRRAGLRTLQSLPPEILRDIGWPAIVDDTQTIVDSQFVHHLPTSLSQSRRSRQCARSVPRRDWHDPII
ncbi:DUF1127 domain-containing protein [Ochrobactrum quorumnocens]|uniref:DUF1127 domain-containing protein n=1 Tax=Ochrobactrum quorumnocens TaxID=271865 RepID=A0A5N1JVV6_9HYPH|nr:DUF1127 domain-containing protein [[Ochrobactrum] quorumnocens]KAA9368262.1 DUF1127 domain-containing protein [[Ochrobactrum] quorumnocens]MBD7991839.1 DUF1127 domain-containing protein [Ochrobactrum gallinarum]